MAHREFLVKRVSRLSQSRGNVSPVNRPAISQVRIRRSLRITCVFYLLNRMETVHCERRISCWTTNKTNSSRPFSALATFLLLIPIRPVNRHRPVRRMNTPIHTLPRFVCTIILITIIISCFLKLSHGEPIESEKTTNNCWISPRSYPIRIVSSKSTCNSSSPTVTRPFPSLPKLHRSKRRAWSVCHISKMDSIFECFPVNMNTIRNASHAGLQWIPRVPSVGETIFSLLAHRLAHIALCLDRERERGANFSFVCNSKNLLLCLCEYSYHVLIERGKQWLSVASVCVCSSLFNTHIFCSSFSTNSPSCLYLCMYIGEVSVVRESTISYIILGHYVFFLFSSGVCVCVCVFFMFEETSTKEEKGNRYNILLFFSSPCAVELMREKKWVYSSTDAHIFHLRERKSTSEAHRWGWSIIIFCEVITGLTVVVVVMHRIYVCVCVCVLSSPAREEERGASVRVCIATGDFNRMSTAIINNKSN